MVKLAPRRLHARAWLAIALSYLLGLNAFVLAATPAQADGFGVICAQNRSAPNQPDHHKGHPCCTLARCCAGAVLAGPPDGVPALPVRIAYTSLRRPVASPIAVSAVRQRAFRARGPPSPVRLIA